MRKESRKKEIKLRKNFLPTFLITLTLWGTIAGIIYFVEPDTLGIVPLFFVLTFLAFLFTFSLAFAHSRRGVLAAIALSAFLLLRYLGVGNVLNFILIAGLAITIELYFSKK